jgi:hypothetical protein
MSLPNYIVSREQHEARSRSQFERLWPDDHDRVDRLMERRYPASLADAVDELRSRGLETDPEHLITTANLAGIDLRVVGRNYLLYPSEIDLLAEILDDRNRLTTAALWRKQCGVSCAHQWAIEVEIAARREAKFQAVADAAGVSLQDAFDRCVKVMRDPLEWTDADIAAAAQRISAETKEVMR